MTKVLRNLIQKDDDRLREIEYNRYGGKGR